MATTRNALQNKISHIVSLIWPEKSINFIWMAAFQYDKSVTKHFTEFAAKKSLTNSSQIIKQLCFNLLVF
jgi:hypothetical protein